MNIRSADLPDFESPPVTEVALSVQFAPLTSLRAAHLGLFWAQFRERFPQTQEHPPVPPVVERFGPLSRPKVGVRLQAGIPLPRCWFLNQKGTELIQVQQDRFVHNWRKVGQGDQYPRYEHIRRAFETELATFEGFLLRESLGVLTPTQCEITYINHIDSGSAWQNHAQLNEVITVWSPRYSDSFLSSPEDARIRIRYVIPGDSAEPIGRLHVDFSPGRRLERNDPIFVMTLTARGRPRGKGMPGALAFLDLGREWIVRGFASLTTQRMHAEWRRKDANYAG